MGKKQESTPEEVSYRARDLGLRYVHDGPSLFVAAKVYLGLWMSDVEELEDVEKRRVAEQWLTEYVEEFRAMILDIEKRLLKIDLE